LSAFQSSADSRRGKVGRACWVLLEGGRGSHRYLAVQITRAKRAGDIADVVDPDVEAHTIVALVIGLSFSILLDHADSGRATEAVDAHLARLAR
jgi:hypothetical protein